MALAVRLTNISKSYRRTKAVKGISLEVPCGILFGFIGPDGAGKSTLLKIIAGILTYDQGELEVLGQKVRNEREAEAVKPRLCFMPQGLGVNLYQELSVEENLDFFGRLRLIPEEELSRRKMELLKLTGLLPFRDRRAKHLSGGMKQKLALICSLIHEPELIILDEPTTGVDPVSREDFWTLLAHLVAERGVTALVSTTYLEEAERFDQISLIHNGRCLAKGSPKEILKLARGKAYLVQAEEPLSALKRLSSLGLKPFPFPEGLKVFVPQGLEIKDKQSFQEVPVDLQDVVLSLTFGESEQGSQKRIELSELFGSAKIFQDEIVIKAHRLTKRFGDFTAVDQVNLEVKKGEIYGLLGPNGAGKTTLIRMLCGLLPPTEGEGLVAGFEMRQAPREIKEHIGYLSQAFSLYRDLTVAENIWFMSGVYGLPGKIARERLKKLLLFTGLYPYRHLKAGELPLGHRQRLALACAVVHGPEIVFLDEPTSGVDVAGRQAFWELIFCLSREAGLTCLVTTHYLVEAEHCDRLSLMHQGRIVAEGPPAELKSNLEKTLGAPWIIEITDPLKALDLLRLKVPVSMMGRRLRFFYPGEEGETLSFLEGLGIKPLSLIRGKVTMDDVFIYHVREVKR